MAIDHFYKIKIAVYYVVMVVSVTYEVFKVTRRYNFLCEVYSLYVL